MNSFPQWPREQKTSKIAKKSLNMSGLISIEMFMALEEEVHDLKEQNKLLKAENNRLRNEFSTKINNMEAQIQKLQPSTSKVQLPGPSNVSVQGSAQRRGPVSVRSVYPSKTSSALQTSAIQKLPTRGPTMCQLPYGHPGSVRGAFQSRSPLQSSFDVSVRKTLPVQRKIIKCPVFPGNPGSSRGGFPTRNPFPGLQTAAPVRGAVPIRNVNQSGHPGSIRAVFPPRSPFPGQSAATSRSVLPSRGVVSPGNPRTPTPIRATVPAREENQGWNFPVRNNLDFTISYKQFKSAIDSSALSNKTSTQYKRPMVNPAIEPSIPMKKTRPEEEEPRFVCRIDTCNYSGCIELPVFKSLDKHRQHMQNVHPKRFLCKRCPFSTKLRGSLKCHEETHVNNDAEFRKRVRKRKWDKGASCTLCNITFAFGTFASCNARLKKHNEQFH